MIDFRGKGINNASYKTWNDIIEKERDTRMKWNLRYKSLEDLEGGEMGWKGIYDKKDYDDHIKRHKFTIPKLEFPPKPNSIINSSNLSNVNEYLTKLGFEDEERKSKRVKPVDVPKEEKDIIYDGISRDFQGRWKYLDIRKKYKPEQKYDFPVTSSMNYGWRLYDECNKINRSQFGDIWNDSQTTPSKYAIKNLVMNNFYRDNGVLNDQWKDDIIKIRTT